MSSSCYTLLVFYIEDLFNAFLKALGYRAEFVFREYWHNTTGLLKWFHAMTQCKYLHWHTQHAFILFPCSNALRTELVSPSYIRKCLSEISCSQNKKIGIPPPPSIFSKHPWYLYNHIISNNYNFEVVRNNWIMLNFIWSEE